VLNVSTSTHKIPCKEAKLAVSLEFSLLKPREYALNHSLSASALLMVVLEETAFDTHNTLTEE
jgi:hypothetical protein